jgi:Uri superfamily endonuclease
MRLANRNDYCVSNLDGVVCCWGDVSQGGTYLLRLTVRQPLLIKFGRFQGGEPVSVPVGDYLYVGSALAQKGSASLARRLLRHASRSGTRPSHPIQAVLLHQLSLCGLGPSSLQSPASKKLHWHIDFLLDEAAVELTAVFLIRSHLPLEAPLARWLTQLPTTQLLVAGLGGTDDPGGTHLLRVMADFDFWHTFPNQLALFLEETQPPGGFLPIAI